MRLPHHHRLIAGPTARGPGPARFSRSFIPTDCQGVAAAGRPRGLTAAVGLFGGAARRRPPSRAATPRPAGLARVPVAAGIPWRRTGSVRQECKGCRSPNCRQFADF